MSETARAINAPFLLSVTALAVAGLLLLISLPSLVSTTAMASTSSTVVSGNAGQMLARHRELMTEYLRRLSVRAPFGKVKPPIIIDKPGPTTQLDNPKPVGEVIYTGPSLIALLGSKAWFKPANAGEGAMRLSIDQEHAGVMLLAVDAPWTARVRYRDMEWTLALFDENRTEAYFGRAPALNQAVPGLFGPNEAMHDDDLFGDRGGLR